MRKNILMKNIIKLFVLLFISGVVITACSSTRNAVGVDTINGFVRTGKWTSLTKEVAAPNSNTTIKTDILNEGKYLEFKSDNKAHIYNAAGTELSTAPYHFTDTKTMIYDGVEYKVQENFVSTITTMTLVNESAAGKTVLIFKR